MSSEQCIVLYWDQLTYNVFSFGNTYIALIFLCWCSFHILTSHCLCSMEQFEPEDLNLDLKLEENNYNYRSHHVVGWFVAKRFWSKLLPEFFMD